MAHTWAYYRVRAKAYAAVQYAIFMGRLTRQPCEACGSRENVEGHHRDYRKPLEVEWLCMRHHRELYHPRIAPRLGSQWHFIKVPGCSCRGCTRPNVR